MECGLSTACLYPCETLDALEQTLALGAREVEIFLNTFREMEPDYLCKLQAACQRAGARVLSMHPFTSGLESALFFSAYTTRWEDGVEFYRKYFAACRQLGATLLVFHGNARRVTLTMQEYAHRLDALGAVAEEYGVVLAQENVERCQCGSVENIRQLRRYAKRPVYFVLDLKQARRAGYSEWEMAQAMGPENIRHLHLSDATPQKDCVLPGVGKFAFSDFFDKLYAEGFAGSAVVELYRDGFESPEDLCRGMECIRRAARGMEEKT